jgi:hypothetical protein
VKLNIINTIRSFYPVFGFLLLRGRIVLTRCGDSLMWFYIVLQQIANITENRDAEAKIN